MAAAMAVDLFDNESMTFIRVQSNDLTDEYLRTITRLTRPLFDGLLQRIGPALQHPTARANACTPDTQLLVALGFFASGGFQWLSGRNVSQPTCSRIVHAVTALLCGLAPEFIKFPFTAEDQTRIKIDFHRIANFPNVLGAIDGTHINIIRPSTEHPEQFVNRHQRFSINVMAVCSADMKFLNVVADYPGSNADAHIWSESRLFRLFENGTIVDGWLLGDSAYPLQPFMMTPVQNPITEKSKGYNKAHKKTRCLIERAFGLLKSRFRCLDNTGGNLAYDPTAVCNIAVACCVLHNMCITAGLLDDIEPDIAERLAAEGIGADHQAAPRVGTATDIQRQLINNHNWP